MDIFWGLFGVALLVLFLVFVNSVVKQYGEKIFTKMMELADENLENKQTQPKVEQAGDKTTAV